ncbi:hypothetical protein [Aerococcus viridans]|uniref:hypothetical protein n=1 Tax=Aerococcus TaxID=1375 RepID=UPI003B2218B6|nr:hypothetical protein [Aerococcus urinaeequi]
MKNHNNDLFFKEVARQLLPFVVRESAETIEYVDEDGNTKADLKHIFESSGADVIDLDDLDDLLAEDEEWLKFR